MLLVVLGASAGGNGEGGHQQGKTGRRGISRGSMGVWLWGEDDLVAAGGDVAMPEPTRVFSTE